MYEKTILFDESTKTDSTNTDSNSKDIQEEIKEEKQDNIIVDIDYKQIEIAYYNALKQVELEKSNREALQKANEQEIDSSVQFASSTDAQLYTVQPASALTSSDAQAVAYLLDTRNILLIFLLGYFCITAYTKLKNTLSKYYGGND